MKKLIIVTCFALISLFTHAQTSTKLDSKNGFNKFIFESSLNDVKKISKLVKSKSASRIEYLEIYDVKDIENYRLFDYPLKQISLSFYRGILYKVVVLIPDYYLDEHSSKRLRDIAEKISGEYGQWTNLDLTKADEMVDLTYKRVIQGNQIDLYRMGHKIKTSGFNHIQVGDTYIFVNRNIHNLITVKTDSGL
jgi:hypothetical protein